MSLKVLRRIRHYPERFRHLKYTTIGVLYGPASAPPVVAEASTKKKKKKLKLFSGETGE